MDLTCKELRIAPKEDESNINENGLIQKSIIDKNGNKVKSTENNKINTDAIGKGGTRKTKRKSRSNRSSRKSRRRKLIRNLQGRKCAKV